MGYGGGSWGLIAWACTYIHMLGMQKHGHMGAWVYGLGFIWDTTSYAWVQRVGMAWVQASSIIFEVHEPELMS